MKEQTYKIVPNFMQNMMLSIFNFKAYKVRYGGSYKKHLSIFNGNNHLSLEELQKIQNKKFLLFLKNTLNNSKFYKKLYEDLDLPKDVSQISKLPILSKELLRQNIKEIYTIKKNQGVVSKTGGTTGKSLEVLFTNENIQERFALIDNFRYRFGYELGKRTAWFSGKSLLRKKDIQKNRFWKTDYSHNVRYYSTFHIKDVYLGHYINNLIKFKPEFLVGFPSSLLEIARYGIANNYNFPVGVVKAIFPTAETITNEMRTVIEKFFRARMYDQYASSEGAPFIFECVEGNLHLELQSGVFEVLDLDDNPIESGAGKLVVTAFTTEATPLIRYDIGDYVELSNKTCNCTNKNPIVNEILGRIDDYIYSVENGKINLGNISNTLKDTIGIKRFQAIQNKLDEIILKVEIDSNIYNKKNEKIFIKNWVDRVGISMKIKIEYVEEIKLEKSGKFRFVKNNIRHLIE